MMPEDQEWCPWCKHEYHGQDVCDVRSPSVLEIQAGKEGPSCNCKGQSTHVPILQQAVPSPQKRPVEIGGPTTRLKYGDNYVYVTVNLVKDSPFEVFINVGKAGTDERADAEAVARLTSLWLRSGGEIREVVKQLSGIGGQTPSWESGELVRSVPDALARVLRKYVGENDA